MKARFFSVFLILGFLVSCQTADQDRLAADAARNKLLMSVAWYQHSAEMAALYYQGFNLATRQLDDAVAAQKPGSSLAVVVDIDETMLDNSPFETSLITSADDLKGWYAWTARASAKALPGALEFARHAESRQVEIFYITNRDDKEREVTLKNLATQGFPFATDDHLLTRADLSYAMGNTSSKTARRAKVAENHEIILLIGDNLNDFSEIFEDRKVNDGKEAVEKNRELFGRKFIILPNPMYGAFEKPLYDYKDGITDREKTQLLRSKLRAE